MKELRTIRQLWPLLRSYPWAVPVTVALGILASLSEGIGITLFLPLLQSLDGPLPPAGPADGLQRFFAGLLSGIPEGRRLPAIALLIVGLTLCKSLLTYTHSVIAAGFNSRLTKRIRSQVYARMLEISQPQLALMGPARLINLLATDTWHTSDALSLFIGLLINLCSILVFSALLVALSWKLTLLVLAAVVFVSLLLRLITRAARHLGHDGVRANTALSELMLDGLDGIREIQMLGLKNHRQQLFESASERVRSIFFRLDLLHRAVPPLSELLYVALLLGLLLIGVTGHSSASTMIIFLLVLYRFQPQVRQLDTNRLSLASLAHSVEDVTAFCQSAPPATPPATPPAPAAARQLPGDIEFDHVLFRYEDQQDLALRGVSFRIPRGRTTAIVGPSGSGKTTLVSLLCGFYSPLAGQIRVGPTALSALDLAAWRGGIAWVCQGAHIFSDTIRENIRYGRLTATPDEVLDAARRADAHSFIVALPDGYDTKVGNGGVALSSGQMQRIALARAFLRRAALLILDEATNALDSLSEDVIQDFLRNRPPGQTVIVISHRLSTLKHADTAIVLDSGRIAESGTPQELATRRGLFSRLRDLQHVE